MLPIDLEVGISDSLYVNDSQNKGKENFVILGKVGLRRIYIQTLDHFH